MSQLGMLICWNIQPNYLSLIIYIMYNKPDGAVANLKFLEINSKSSCLLIYILNNWITC